MLRTILTYLELLGVLRQGTPFYAAYEARPLVELREIVRKFAGERAQFITSIFGAAKKGRIWYSLDPAQVGARLGAPRERVLRALQYLDDQGLIELRASEARLRFSRVDSGSADPAMLLGTLMERFGRREEQEIARLQQVLALVHEPGCQTAALVAYFGETLDGPCGHCGSCAGTHRPALPADSPPPSIAQTLDAAAFASLCRAHPEALADPRQQARFLCGLTSPALTQARLSRHPLFGCLEVQRFGDVLAWCQRTTSSAPD